MPLGKKPLHTGGRTGCHYSISSSVCLSVCVTFVVFADCESCTRPLSTNSGSMEAGEYGLTRGTRLVARNLEVGAVARLLWISWCVLGGADFFVFFFLRTHTRPAANMRPPCLIYLSTSITGIIINNHHQRSSRFIFFLFCYFEVPGIWIFMSIYFSFL